MLIRRYVCRRAAIRIDICHIARMLIRCRRRFAIICRHARVTAYDDMMPRARYALPTMLFTAGVADAVI